MYIRRMAEKDLKTVVELEKQVFPNPWSRRSFEFEIRENAYSIPLVLEADKEVIGYAIVWKLYEEFHIANLAIRPEYQGRKLGSNFLEHILTLTEGCGYALLEVRESNKRAIRLYEKFGFRVIMQRPHYYKNGETALVMQKILDRPSSVSRSANPP